VQVDTRVTVAAGATTPAPASLLYPGIGRHCMLLALISIATTKWHVQLSASRDFSWSDGISFGEGVSIAAVT